MHRNAMNGSQKQHYWQICGKFFGHIRAMAQGCYAPKTAVSKKLLRESLRIGVTDYLNKITIFAQEGHCFR